MAVPFGATGKVARFTPDGVLDLQFDVPGLVPTMVTFGGPEHVDAIYHVGPHRGVFEPAGVVVGRGHLRCGNQFSRNSRSQAGMKLPENWRSDWPGPTKFSRR